MSATEQLANWFAQNRVYAATRHEVGEAIDDNTDSRIESALKALRKRGDIEYDKAAKVWRNKLIQPNALGCYIFAGSFTHGMRRAGFNCLAHFEEGDYGVETASHNFPEMRIWQSPITWPTRRFAGKVDVVYGNPPCAPWSPIGKSMGHGSANWETDERVQCVHNHFRVFRETQPKIWVWESVPRAASSGRPLVDSLIAQAADMGYAATELFNSAQTCGMAQLRRRFMLVLHNIEIDWTLMDIPERPYVVGDVIKNMKPDADVSWLTKEERKVYEACKPGEGMRAAWDRLNPDLAKQLDEGEIERDTVRGRPPYVRYRLAWDKHAGVISSMDSQIHPDEPRSLALNEIKALCGIGDDFEYRGPRDMHRPQMAQAVMSPVARHLGQVLRRAVINDKRLQNGVTSDHYPMHQVVDWDKEVNAIWEKKGLKGGRVAKKKGAKKKAGKK